MHLIKLSVSDPLLSPFDAGKIKQISNLSFHLKQFNYKNKLKDYESSLNENMTLLLRKYGRHWRFPEVWKCVIRMYIAAWNFGFWMCGVVTSCASQLNSPTNIGQLFSITIAV